MKSSVVFKKKNTKLLLLSLFVATAFLAICSKSSPLYPFNDWVDANCFFTMGKSMMNGMVPYKELYEQKGPLLYFLYGLASFISYKSFLGVYLLEVISFGGFLFFSLKTVKLYVDEEWLSLLSLLVIAFSVVTSNAFAHGGSAEELCLVFLSFSLYTALASIKENRAPTSVETLLNGVFAGCVFLIKYSMLGFYIGYFVFLIILRLLRKEGFAILKQTGLFLLGAAVVCIPFVIYLALNGALLDCFNAYIYNNIFLYSNSGGSLITVFFDLLIAFRSNPITGFLIISGLILYLLKRNREALLVLLSFLGLIIFIFIGGRYYLYYPLILSAFSVFGVIALATAINAKIKEPPKRTVQTALVTILSLVLLIVSFFVSDNTYLLKYKKEDMPQYKFAEIINHVNSPTLLNYSALDLGVYTASGVMPSCKYFCGLNIPLKEIDETQRRYIADEECDFIVTINPLEDYGIRSDAYCLAASESMPFEGAILTYYLYKRC